MEESVNNKDLTKKMINLLIPLILTNSLNILIYIINSVWIGRLIGENGVAAISNCYPMTVILSAVIIAFANAVAVIISQYYGADDKEKIKGTIGFGYVFSAIVGVVIAALVIIFSNNFLGVLGTPEVVFDDAQKYLSLYSIAFIFNFTMLIVSESIRALGDAKIPLIFVGIETVLNVVFVPAFILADLGIVGVGLANVISKLLVLIITIIFVNYKYSILKIDKEYLKISKFYLKKVLYIGIPVMIEQYVIALVITLETSISNKSGVTGSAAYGVVARWEQIFLVISQSLQTVITILVGQHIGKKEMDKVQAIMINGIKLAVIPTALIALVVFGAPNVFCRMFINTDDVIQVAVRYLSVVGFAYILMPIRLMLNGFIIGTAHTRYLLITCVTASILEIIVMYTLLDVYNIESMTVLGLSVLTYVVTDTLLSLGFYFSGLWKSKVITN